MSDIFCDKHVKFSIDKTIHKYNSCIFIFHGIKGIGKRTFANFFTQNLLDFDINNIPVDGYSVKSRNANLFKNKTHPDVFILENNDNKKIKIEDVRLLKHFLSSTSSISTNKIVIIDPIESLSSNAANTLLKNFEELKNNTYIFLISHNYLNVLNTIKSRVFKYYFKPLDKKTFLKINDIYNNKTLNTDELLLIESIFNFSPGQYFDIINRKINLLDNYQNFLFKMQNLFNPRYNVEKNINLKFKEIEIDLKIKFITNFFKNLLFFYIKKSFDRKVISFEKDIIGKLNLNDFLLDKIYNGYNSFQLALNDAIIYNSSKEELIETFFNKVNYINE